MNIQPHLAKDQLQEIADALNGTPEARDCNLTLSDKTSCHKYQNTISVVQYHHVYP